MAFQPVPDVAEVVMRFEGTPASEIPGAEAQMTFYVRDEITSWTATTLGQLADYFVDWFDNGKGLDPALDTVIDDGWVLSTVTARDLSQEGGVSVTRFPALTVQRAGAIVPPNLAMLVRYQLDAGGNPTRGSVFVPVGTEPDLEGQNWSAALVTEVQNVFDGMDENLSNALDGGDADWAQVRVSRTAGTEAQLAQIRALREDLRQAIAATRRATAQSNTLAAPVAPRRLIASQRDRRGG